MKFLKIISYLTIIISIFSCNTVEDEDNEIPENYINFQIGTTNYIGAEFPSFNLNFDDLNYYDKDLDEIQGVTSSSDFFKIPVFSSYSHPDLGSSVINSNGTVFYSNVTKLDCNSNSNKILEYEINVTRNDDELGGIIQGDFNGKIGRPSGLPCQNCCYYIYNFSGSFRLKIK
jgi:hypothetical protein